MMCPAEGATLDQHRFVLKVLANVQNSVFTLQKSEKNIETGTTRMLNEVPPPASDVWGRPQEWTRVGTAASSLQTFNTNQREKRRSKHIRRVSNQTLKGAPDLRRQWRQLADSLFNSQTNVQSGKTTILPFSDKPERSTNYENKTLTTEI